MNKGKEGFSGGGAENWSDLAINAINQWEISLHMDFFSFGGQFPRYAGSLPLHFSGLAKSSLFWPPPS